MGIARRLLLEVSENQALSGYLARRPFVRRAVTRFMPGDNLDAAMGAAATLADAGLPAIFTVLGENVTDADAASAAADEYGTVLRRVKERGLDPYVSVKPTHLGLDLGVEAAARNLVSVTRTAGALDGFVAVDMEASGYVESTLELYRRLRADRANVGLCVQSYLYRTASDVEQLLPLEPMIRVVKGAYKEPAGVAYPRKRDVDASYLRLADKLLDAVAAGRRVRVAFGTHDLGLLDQIRGRADAMRLPPDAYEIQMLYGIQREAQARLRSEGHRVRVLISYGGKWFPWYMRRLAERPANVGFVLRNVLTR